MLSAPHKCALWPAGHSPDRWIGGASNPVDDVRAGRSFLDAIARTAWPIELHDRAESYVWEAFPDDHVHYVPFGSLVPAEADNVVAAGRCIDGDSAALSSVQAWALHRHGRSGRSRPRSRRQRQRTADRHRGTAPAREGQRRAGKSRLAQPSHQISPFASCAARMQTSGPPRPRRDPPRGSGRSGMRAVATLPAASTVSIISGAF